MKIPQSTKPRPVVEVPIKKKHEHQWFPTEEIECNNHHGDWICNLYCDCGSPKRGYPLCHKSNCPVEIYYRGSYCDKIKLKRRIEHEMRETKRKWVCVCGKTKWVKEK